MSDRPVETGPPDCGRASARRRIGRLRRTADFRRIARAGKRLENELFSMRLATGGRPGPPIRVAVGTPSYVGKAVVRNRARRRAREAIRSLLCQSRKFRDLPSSESRPTALDVVVVAKAGCGQATYAQIYESLGSLLRMAGMC